MALLYPQCSHILMTKCDVNALGDSLGLFIHVPESAMLMERHAGLKSIRILDPEVISSVARERKEGSKQIVTLELVLSNERRFTYSVTELRVADSTIWLDVSEDAASDERQQPIQ